MQVRASAEDYLESILVLQKKHGAVRSVDVARSLGYSKPSVSNAMKKLRESSLVVVDAEGYIDFTKEGRKIAERVYESHLLLTNFFIAMGVSEGQAREDACRIEHVISEESLQKIKEHAKRAHGKDLTKPLHKE